MSGVSAVAEPPFGGEAFELRPDLDLTVARAKRHRGTFPAMAEISIGTVDIYVIRPLHGWLARTRATARVGYAVPNGVGNGAWQAGAGRRGRAGRGARSGRRNRAGRREGCTTSRCSRSTCTSRIWCSSPSSSRRSSLNQRTSRWAGAPAVRVVERGRGALTDALAARACGASGDRSVARRR